PRTHAGRAHPRRPDPVERHRPPNRRRAAGHAVSRWPGRRRSPDPALIQGHLMPANKPTMTSSRPEHTGALLRHFADLRDGSHGAATSRPDKERLFAEAVALLDPYARQALDEIDA